VEITSSSETMIGPKYIVEITSFKFPVASLHIQGMTLYTLPND
jgi:hypothetical protein